MVFRSRYWLFYLLTFLSGARRQVFVAFAVFLLVEKFGYSVQEITALFILNNVVNWYLSPAIGRAVNKYGERRMLTVEYVSLIFIFVAYAYVDSKILVAVLYVLDHVFYNFAMAIKTYFQKIADPSDIAPSMAVSFTINHIAAVVIPAAGGLLWMVDYRIPFLCAAGLAGLSLLFSQFVRVPEAEGK
jgi:MFS family permease